jgi:hypothetical protein
MQTIAINLLAEEQMLEEARARDPVKAAAAIGIGLVTLVTLAGSALSMYDSRKKAEMAVLQSKLEAISAQQTKGEAANFNALRSLAEDLLAVNQSRVLCAPQLALLKDLTPDTIQLTRVSVSIAVETQEPPAAAPAAVADTEPKRKRAATPKSTERLTLRLEGRAVSRRPELEVDAFLQTLRSAPALGAQLQQVHLRSVARAPVTSEEGANSSPAAYFVVECQYKERS